MAAAPVPRAGFSRTGGRGSGRPRMGEWFHSLVQGHATWVVGVIIFFESMGVPLPGESLLIAAAIYAATKGGLSIEWVVVYAAVGAIMGDNAGYLIGRTAGRKALRRWGPKVG